MMSAGRPQPGSSRTSAPVRPGIGPASTVLDLSGALARLGGDEQLYADMVQFLREDSPSLLNELQTGLSAGDAPRVRRAAHSLKGLVANCGGVRAAEAAQCVENAGAAGDIAEAAHLVEPLIQEIEALMQAMTAAAARSHSTRDRHAR
jgi:two-component system sensor histidine kinase/response regulator